MCTKRLPLLLLFASFLLLFVFGGTAPLSAQAPIKKREAPTKKTTTTTKTTKPKTTTTKTTKKKQTKSQPKQQQTKRTSHNESTNRSSSTSNNYLTFNVGGVSFTMIKVDGGTFMMGANSGDSEAWDDEKPRHQVTLSDYYIGQTEVTQALWQAVMGSNPSRFKGDNLPVEHVSWNDCQAFISKLNALTGQSFSLPTEAEWELAARGGNKSRGYKYSGSNSLDAVAWYENNSRSKTHAVATKQANELGIYDMSGNVYEWCADWVSTYPSTSQTNPTGPSSGSGRVKRGGCWISYARGSRVSSRSFLTPTDSDNNLGLRLSIHR